MWRILFIVAGLYNFAAGLMPLLAPAHSLVYAGLPPDTRLFMVQSMGALLTTFGIGYFMVARDLSLRPIVWLGVIGKSIFVAIIVIHYTSQSISFSVAAPGIGDALFVALFLLFLLRRPA